MSLVINGVQVPHEVVSAEWDGEGVDPVTKWCQANGVPLVREKGQGDPIPEPLAKLRENLYKRQEARQKERERVAARNKELAEKNAPVKSPARAVAKAAPTQGVSPVVKSGDAK